MLIHNVCIALSHSLTFKTFNIDVQPTNKIEKNKQSKQHFFTTRLDWNRVALGYIHYLHKLFHYPSMQYERLSPNVKPLLCIKE
jgi:hypothetical protein